MNDAVLSIEHRMGTVMRAPTGSTVSAATVCRLSTGWVRSCGAYWRASVIQQEPESEERWNVHIYCALRTPPYFGGHDRAYLLHAGGKPYSAPIAASIHRAERWYWQAVLGRDLRYGPGNPQSDFELANGIPAADDPLLGSGGIAVAGVSQYPDQPERSQLHTTLPVECGGQWRTASVVRDGDTGEWGVWLENDPSGWLQAGGSPYRAPATVCAHRAERWYWQLVRGESLCHGHDFPQHWWEQQHQIPDLDDAARLPQLA